jgi:hypothetical protein
MLKQHSCNMDASRAFLSGNFTGKHLIADYLLY